MPIASKLKSSVKMKSNTQTYDIKDNELYKGIFETEFILQQMKIQKDKKIDAGLAVEISKAFNFKNKKSMRFKPAKDEDYNKSVKFIRKLLDEEIAKKMKNSFGLGGAGSP